MCSRRGRLLSSVTFMCVIATLVLPRGTTNAQDAEHWAKARAELVELISEGVKHPKVLQSVAATERHLFVPEAHLQNAYVDMSLPIGGGVTISPPYMVAFMTEQLDPQPTDRVLEIGTGSGYQAAILSPLVEEVFTIEIIKDLGHQAATRLQKLGYGNVHVKVGDGFKGWPQHAPFDKIIVTCSPEKIPQPLIDQLKDDGTMLIPLGTRYQQSLCLVTKRDGNLHRRVLEPTFFVPMTGRAEELRETKQDDGVPILANGSFELLGEDGELANWYYLRQAELVTNPDLAHGSTFLRLTNSTQGRAAHSLQATGLDGRRFKELSLDVAARIDEVALPDEDSFAGIEINFYDEQRHNVGTVNFGPWTGTADWTEYGTRFQVPSSARLMMIQVGLYGATGTLEIDNLRMEAHTTKAKGPFD